MKSLGPLYVDKINYPVFKSRFIMEIGWTNETDGKFRKGRCIVVKFPRTCTAFLLGIWVRSQDEDTALYGAIMAREVPLDEVHFEDF